MTQVKMRIVIKGKIKKIKGTANRYINKKTQALLLYSKI